MATIKTKRNDSFRAVFSFIEDGAAASLAGCTARMQLRTRSDTIVLDVSTSDYLTIDASSVISDVPASLMDMPLGKYLADIQLTYQDGSVRSSKTFTVLVEKDITRDP